MFKHIVKWAVLLATLVLITGGAQSVFAADKPFAEKKIVLQISDPDPFWMPMVSSSEVVVIPEKIWPRNWVMFRR